MSLTPPKRLFDVKIMKTVMYDDVKSNVEKDGYITISHVWGDQERYNYRQLKIRGGVSWKIPLSDISKMHRVEKAMKQYGKRYCWWDVLCMPQNKQDEINEEIPFMGDYYAGACATFVLFTKQCNFCEEFLEWKTDDMINSGKLSEKDKLLLGQQNPFDMSEDPWLRRVWTFQEALLSQKLFLVDGRRIIDLFDVADKIVAVNRIDVTYISAFKASGPILASIQGLRHNLQIKTLAILMHHVTVRDCYKLHDKFYGILGILGYKDFVVDYDISVDDLNKKMAQYAYSKGDVSWIGIGGDEGTGFIQPMYKPFTIMGFWEEDDPGSCVRFDENNLWLDVQIISKITDCRKITKSDDDQVFFRQIMDAFLELELETNDLIYAILLSQNNIPKEFIIATYLYICFVAGGFTSFVGDTNHSDVDAINQAYGEDISEYISRAKSAISLIYMLRDILTIAKITSGTDIYPVIVSGNANIGDLVMLTKIRNPDGRTLGIIVDESGRRKGICVHEKMDLPYVAHKFIL